ncbi:Fur family transcriptional regulator [Luethyella okanaganae]|uniref:Fur family transcriptional regulator n=1 Tax=Luethyella okanaganae TaxID=69372 RepID=A0ABW1VEU8_9MICO
MGTSSPSPVPRLRSVGLRVTALRVAVVELLSGGGHLSAEVVFQRVVQRLPGTSLQAVYNVLAVLVENGIARRVEPAGSPALYELSLGDNHHHLVCRVCRRVVDVPCMVGAEPCLTPGEAHGFSVETAEVTFWGVCSDCA